MEQLYQTLYLEKISEHILVITLNRQEVHNAINAQMMQDLRDCFARFKNNPDHLRCIIITGRGEKAFCAGADLKERLHLSLELWQAQHKALQQAMLNMLDCPIPMIAAVNGVAYGGGLEITLACDFAYASEQAIFAQSEVKLGIMPGAMGTQQLAKAVGVRRAKELSFTGEAFSATQAHAWGLVNRVCDAAEVLDYAIATANKIAANAPLAVAAVKDAIQASQHLELKSGYQYELKRYQQLLPTQDREEGIAAFNEKRKPHFTAS